MEAARSTSLQALVASRVARASGRIGTILSALAAGALAMAMVVLHLADGRNAFLEGVVARGVTIHLVLASLPFALSVARLGRVWPGDPAISALAALQGLSADDVASVVPGAVMRVAARRALWVGAPLAILATLLTLSEPHLVLRRFVATALLVLLGALAAAGLAGLSALLAARTRRLAGVSLIAVFFVPWLVVLLVPALPFYASLPGAYAAVREQILDASAR